MAPRYTKHAAMPDLTAVGGNLAPTMYPLSFVQVSQGVATYRTLFTTLDAGGVPRQSAHVGTFAPTPFGAGPRTW